MAQQSAQSNQLLDADSLDPRSPDLGRSTDQLLDGPHRPERHTELESYVRSRCPEFGSAYFPLSPAIEPGFQRLGPAAGYRLPLASLWTEGN
jgi:hypothetical protein